MATSSEDELIENGLLKNIYMEKNIFIVKKNDA
jgi:hypothetical protein